MDTARRTKLGLVLSGGGAKGAYEVGVLKALARCGCCPEVVAGASIGAVKGAVVASSPDLLTAATSLETLWNGVTTDSVLKLKPETAPAHYLALVGLNLLVRTYFATPMLTLSALISSIPQIRDLFSDDDRRYISMLDHSPIEALVEKAVDLERLLSPGALDFYVSVYPASKAGGLVGLAKDVVRYAVSRDKSEFFRLKDVPRDTAAKLILASAAIPFAFKPMEYQGRRFYDGGMGDRVKAQGNTPVEPLVKAGCTHAIVVIIGNGVPWDRYEWPDLTVLEIRPSKVIDGMLDFDPARIRALIALGEQDATRSLARFAKASAEVQGLMRAHQ